VVLVTLMASPALPAFNAPDPAGSLATAPERLVARATKRRKKRRAKRPTPPAVTRPDPTSPAAASEPPSEKAAPPRAPAADVPAPTEAGPPATVLVLDIAAAGVPPAVAKQTTAHVAKAVAQLANTTALTRDDLARMAEHEEARELLGCSESRCAADLGARIDADQVVTGSVGMVGASVTVNLALVDAERGVASRRVSRLVPGQAELGATVQEAVGELFGRAAPAAKAFSLPTGRLRSFAVLDLVASGVPSTSARNLTQILMVELEQIEGASVVGRDDIKAMLELETHKQMVGCADDTACVAEIGAALGVEYLVAGTVGKVADTYVISLRLIAPNEARVENRVTEAFVGREDQLVGAVRHSARDLVGVRADAAGSLAVRAGEEAALAWVDGKPTGVISAEAISGLSPGRHTLRVSKEDFLDWSSDVYVQPSSATLVNVALEPVPGTWYSSPWFWTAVGAVVVGAGAGGYLWYRSEKSSEPTYPFGVEIGLPQR
jgi:TolB-like protein